MAETTARVRLSYATPKAIRCIDRRRPFWVDINCQHYGYCPVGFCYITRAFLEAGSKGISLETRTRSNPPGPNLSRPPVRTSFVYDRILVGISVRITLLDSRANYVT